MEKEENSKERNGRGTTVYSYLDKGFPSDLTSPP